MLKFPYKKLTPLSVTYATESSKRYYDATLAEAKKLTEDPDKNLRLIEQKCISCYYRGLVAGNAMTINNCNSCGVELKFSNTDVDRLCHTCAADHELCRKCGGDIKMRVRRKFHTIVRND